MSLTIEISGELEPILAAAASKAGLDMASYTHQLLRMSLPTSKPEAPSVPAEEARLLQEINRGLPAEQLDRYRELIGKRQRETINPEEFRQLTDLTHQMEALQTQRVEALTKLAALRHLSLVDLMAKLEIRPPDVL